MLLRLVDGQARARQGTFSCRQVRHAAGSPLDRLVESGRTPHLLLLQHDDLALDVVQLIVQPRPAACRRLLRATRQVACKGLAKQGGVGI